MSIIPCHILTHSTFYNTNSLGIPYSAPPRDDFDKNKVLCQVIDCVFHPDTLRMALKNAAFKQMINSTALDSVAEKFSVTLDRANVKTPKMNYKGSDRESTFWPKL